MKKTYNAFFSLFIPFSLISKNNLDLTQKNVINWNAISYDYKARYEAIKPILNKYKRPITVLDLGAYDGYFIAKDYQATCVMIQGSYHDQEKIIDQPEDFIRSVDRLSNIIFLNKKFTFWELKKLGECEHFDVVLAFNVINRFGSDWKIIADAIFSLGDTIIIETPSYTNKEQTTQILSSIKDYLKKKGGTLIAKNRSKDSLILSKTYWFEKKKKILNRTSWIHAIEKNKLIITSNYTEKFIYHGDKHLITPWVSGINLTTYLMLEGIYPKWKTIKNAIIQLLSYSHTSCTIWNFIVQGNAVKILNATREQKKLTPTFSYEALCDFIEQSKEDKCGALNKYIQKIQSALDFNDLNDQALSTKDGATLEKKYEI